MTPDEAAQVLAAPVRFTEVGYGSSCSACGALVLRGDQAQHRRAHEALATLAVTR